MSSQDVVRQHSMDPDADAVLLRLADFAGGGLGWLWRDRFPLGKLTLLVGDPGVGKSLLALDMAARVTRGLPWPDESVSGSAPRGRVLLLSAEDDASDTVRPRLEALGGDSNRLAVLQAVRRPGARLTARMFSVARDLPAIGEAICQSGDFRLVIVDPLSAYLAGRDGGNNAAVRAALLPLQALGECSGAAVVAIGHLNKRGAGSALYRPMGSLAYVAAPRAAWAVVADGGCPGRRLLLALKSNLSAPPAGLAFRIVPSAGSPEVPVLAWAAEGVAMSAEEAMARQCAPRAREEAVGWLAELLSGGPLRCRDVQRQAREVGFTPTAMRAAREALEVVTFRQGYAGPWMLRLGARMAASARVEAAPEAQGPQGQASAPSRGPAAEGDWPASPAPAACESGE